MKGIILAGGSGSRLNPLTFATNKQLLPIYDKPIIYYPLSVLMLLEIKDILIISTPEGVPVIQKLLGNGSQFGINLSYIVQDRPRGLADAFILGKEFIKNDRVCLILGDNLFFGNFLVQTLRKDKRYPNRIFAYEVSDPTRYGVVEFDKDMKILSIEEKPINPKSSYAIPGIYFFDKYVSAHAEGLKPSSRGEIEITDIMKAYLSEEGLDVSILERGIAWLDVGTHDSLQEASNFVSIIQRRQGIMIACLEEIAYNMKFISLEKLEDLVSKMAKNSYSDYLNKFIRKIKNANSH